MKFCKNLQKVVDISDPEWTPFWMNYKLLKKMIKELPNYPTKGTAADSDSDDEDSVTSSLGGGDNNNTNNNPSLEETAAAIAKQSNKRSFSESSSSSSMIVSSTTNLNQPASSPREVNPEILNKCPSEIQFFKVLHLEVEKATKFFHSTLHEYNIRLDRVKEGIKYIAQVGKIGLVLVKDLWLKLAKASFRLYKDLLLLENYAIMTDCAFSKILKKHDKNTGFGTREAFMVNVVKKSNFANYPDLLEMINFTQVSSTLKLYIYIYISISVAVGGVMRQ